MANGLKGIKKDDKVIMRLFTGAFSGVKTVEKVDKTGIYFTTGKGLSKFDIKTGKMVDPAPKSERFANYIEEYDEAVEKAENKKKAKSQKKAAKKRAEAKRAAEEAELEELEDEEIEEELEEEEEEEEPAPKPKKKKKVAKKVKGE